ncbi:MAG: flagellar hook-basal body complex protein FliE [Phycisphaerae bacterium]|jgi:flagellar hook-basal body complex protein FliE
MTSIGPISGINPAISPAAPLSDAKAAPGGAGFADTLKNALDQVDRTQQNSGAAIQDTVSGNADNLLGAVSAMAEADMSFKLLIGVRNKVIEAYKQTMNMQI